MGIIEAFDCPEFLSDFHIMISPEHCDLQVVNDVTHHDIPASATPSQSKITQEFTTIMLLDYHHQNLCLYCWSVNSVSERMQCRFVEVPRTPLSLLPNLSSLWLRPLILVWRLATQYLLRRAGCTFRYLSYVILVRLLF